VVTILYVVVMEVGLESHREINHLTDTLKAINKKLNKMGALYYQLKQVKKISISNNKKQIVI